jgi:hypothetical protein
MIYLFYHLLYCQVKNHNFLAFLPNPDKPEPKRINHENTKFGKHEIFLLFRVLVLSWYRG